MYLPSKIKSKYFLLISIAIFLFFFAFKGFFRYLILFTSDRLLHYPTTNRQRLLELKLTNLELKLKLVDYQAVKVEDEKLRQALKFKVKTNYKLVGADVLSFSPSLWQRLIVINAGRAQGLAKGLFAIDEGGHLLGKIVEVEDEFSQLILVNDPSFTASVFVGENASGLLEGGLAGAKVLYLEDSDNIKIGDRVWLKVNQLAAPIEIGKVKDLNKNHDNLFWNVGVELFKEKTFFNQVYIIK